MRFSSFFSVSAGAAAFVMLATSTARAGVSVQGTPEAIRVEADKATIEEVLGALHDAYDLTYASKVPLVKQVTGVYDGPLSRVLARLLHEMNFVLSHRGKALHLVITSSVGRQATPSAAPPPSASSKPDPNPQFPPGFFPPPPPSTLSARDKK
jgi:hypothetical protein